MFGDLDFELGWPGMNGGGYDHIGLGEASVPDITKFTSNAKGVEQVSSSQLALNHDLDSVTLSNPYPKSVAVFYVTQTWNKFKKKLGGGKGDRVATGQKNGTITIKEGQKPVVTGNLVNVQIVGNAATVSNKEGWVDEKGLFKDFYYDRDTNIELRTYTPPPVAGEPPPAPIYSEGGGGVEQPSLLPSMEGAGTYIVVGIVVLAAIGGAYYYWQKRGTPAA